MKEGSLEAPTRHAIAWKDDDFYDREKLDTELRRVFDICHTCRRCFNLCDSFPKLFDLIDDSETGELDSVESKDFKGVIDACTLCDMCYLTKCPYVPPHEWNIDFPHLMLRSRVIDEREGKVPFLQKQIVKTDRNGKLAGSVESLANWANKCGNGITRPVMAAVCGIHEEAKLPDFHGNTYLKRAASTPVEVNTKAPAHGRKVALYATCSVNYNNPDIGMATRAVLALNGVEVASAYPECCGMPQLEQGAIAEVAEKAERISRELCEWIDRGYDIVALVPSCALMMKKEWPLIVPDSETVKKLSQQVYDTSEYIVDINKKEGLVEGRKPLDGGVTAHISCHSRAQEMGQKAAEMLRLIPDTPLQVIERCSGHGGSWGVFKENFEVALKVGKPVARKVANNMTKYVVSECPLARDHILQGVEKLDQDVSQVESSQHPIQLLAKSYGL